MQNAVISHVSDQDQVIAQTARTAMVKRFMAKMSLTEEQAEELWNDTVRFLKLAATANAVPSRIIDDAWHEFILHTRLYSDFCRKSFGRFIHHAPSDGSKTLEDYRLGAEATAVRAFDMFGRLSQNWFSKPATCNERVATCDQCSGPE